MTSCPRCARTFDDGVRFCPVDGTLVTSSQPEDRHLGQVLLGQFEVRDVCGRGAMGTVYRAYQRNMDRIVAVKILRRELLKEPEVVRRFLREARAAAKLQHPNIVTVHLVGETDDGVPFLVMEHIDGVVLEAICEAQGAQPLPRLLSIARQIAGALAEAHDAGIVHRDLKPANILITDRSRVPDLVKVLDFGIAKLVTGADQSMLTRDGMIFGTPHYIAPEQATGGDIDHRADLYSLGVILFRLATGRLPFEGTAGMQVVLKHLREQPPRPREIDPTLPASLEALILQLLSKERGDRPRDAEAVVRALEGVTAAEPAPGDPKGTLLGVAPPRALRPQVTSDADARTLRPPTAADERYPHANDVRAHLAKDAGKPQPAQKKPPILERPPRPERPVTTPSRGLRPPEATAKMKPASAAGVIEVGAPPRAPRWLLGAGIAVLLGAGVGVGGALYSNRAEPGPSAALATPVALPEPPPRPEPPKAVAAPLAEEHVLTEGALTLRAGFERPPAVRAPSPLVVQLAEGTQPIAAARVEVVLQPPSGSETKLALPAAAEPGRYRAEWSFERAGRHKLSVLARLPGRAQPVALRFDVEPQAPEVRAGRRARGQSSSEPAVTVLPPSDAPKLAGAEPQRPPPKPEPARPQAEPARPQPKPEPARPAEPAPAAPVTVEPARVPERPAERVPERPAERPPERPRRPPAVEVTDDRPPPPAPDPTTLPLPGPDDTH